MMCSASPLHGPEAHCRTWMCMNFGHVDVNMWATGRRVLNKGTGCCWAWGCWAQQMGGGGSINGIQGANGYRKASSKLSAVRKGSHSQITSREVFLSC